MNDHELSADLTRAYRSLARGECGDPFSHLGFQRIGEKLAIRVWQPDATDIEILDGDGKSIGFMRRLADGQLFELKVPERLKETGYKVRVINQKGEFTRLDPYQFAEHAYHAVHFVDHAPNNIYRQLGAQLVQVTVGERSVHGTRFSVFAPNAMSVSLIGDFNWWDGQYLPMQKTELGYWVLFVPGIESGQRYKFEIKGASGKTLPHKADPVGFLAEQHPSHASVVYDHEAYVWGDEQWRQREPGNLYAQPMSIYEVHLGSWKRHYDGDTSRVMSYRELAHELVDYVTDMGFTHIELMPVSEHPFDGSWGYQPVGLFAPSSRFGSPDDFKYFVDVFHQAGIGVILDWVPAHFPSDEHGLGKFDGSCVYEYEDPRKGWHPDWDSYVYDFGKQTVRQFLVASALYWLDRFHIDGIRVDAVASMLYLDYSREDGEWIPNVDGGNHNYEAISLFQWLNKEVYLQFPNAMTIAEESTSFPGVTTPVDQGGLGFGFKWNMGWMNDSLRYMAEDPINRAHHHDKMTFSLVYAWDENFILPLSHDEVVHSKASILYKMPGDEWQQAANLRAYYAFMFAHPGKKLNFMGNEIAQGNEWSHQESIQWHLLDFDKHQGIYRLFKVLNRLYSTIPALFENDHDPSGFEWIDLKNSENSIFCFARRSNLNEVRHVYCVFNLTPIPRENYRIPVFGPGTYELILNTDDVEFWGSGHAIQRCQTSELKPVGVHGYSLCCDLPPLSALYFEKREDDE